MLSSVRKNIVLSLIAAPLAMSYGFAQTAVGTVAADSISLAARSTVLATNELYLNQWVHVAGDGTIKGSVVALMGQDSINLSKMRVSLNQNGNAVAFDDTDIDGEFLIEKVSPGLYSLVAEGSGSLAMFSLAVLDPIAGKHLPNSVDVRVMPTSSRIAELIRSQSIPRVSSVAVPTEDPLAKNRKMATSHQVMLDASGVLFGRLGKAAALVDMSSMTVFITKDGVEISRARAAEDGSFSIPGLAPACYGLVAAGDQGVAAVGFCAVNHSVAASNSSGKVYVSQPNISSSLNIEVGDAPFAENTVKAPNEAVANATQGVTGMAPIGMAPGFGGAGFGGGGSIGGGGGGGIGGGIGALAGIGGLIAVGIIAADDNNNNTVTSPIVP